MASLDLFGAVGYGVAAILFLVLAVLLLTGWRGRMQGGLLVAASFTTAVWAGGLALQAGWHSLTVHWLWVLEALRDLVWVMFLLAVLEIQLEATPRLRRITRRSTTLTLRPCAWPFRSCFRSRSWCWSSRYTATPRGSIAGG
ncbi:MAG: hypothetical protein P8Y27_16975 [Chromatiaceae bacterium]